MILTPNSWIREVTLEMATILAIAAQNLSALQLLIFSRSSQRHEHITNPAGNRGSWPRRHRTKVRFDHTCRYLARSSGYTWASLLEASPPDATPSCLEEILNNLGNITTFIETSARHTFSCTTTSLVDSPQASYVHQSRLFQPVPQKILSGHIKS